MIEFILKNKFFLFATVAAFLLTPLADSNNFGFGGASITHGVVFVLALLSFFTAFCVVKRRDSFFKREPIDIPLYIDFIKNENENLHEKEKMLEMICEHFGDSDYLEKLKLYTDLDTQSLIYEFAYTQEKTKIFENLAILGYELEEIKRRIYYKYKKHIRFHVAYRGTSALAFGLQKALKNSMIALYQYDAQKQKLNLTFDIKDRTFKARSGENRHFKTKFTPCGTSGMGEVSTNEKLVIAIAAASHDASTADVKDASVLEVSLYKNDKKTNLIEGQMWHECLNELFEIVSSCANPQNSQNTGANSASEWVANMDKFSQIELRFSMPTTLATALSLALGNYWSVSIMHFDNKSSGYITLFSLNEL